MSHTSDTTLPQSQGRVGTSLKDAKHALLSDPSYDPNNLLDVLIEKLNLKNDAELARALGVWPPLISRVRHCKLPIGASLLITMHEISGIKTRDLRALMGDKRRLPTLGHNLD